MTINAVPLSATAQAKTIFPAPVPGTVPAWTVEIPSPDSRLIYVSTSGAGGQIYTYGSGGSGVPGVGSGGTFDNPVGENAYNSIDTAKLQLRDGFPDYLLFKKGDEWVGGIGDIENNGGGRGLTEPKVYMAYGTGARPQFTSGMTAIGSNDLDNIHIKGLHFYNKTRDPNDPGYSPSSDGGTGIYIFRPAANLLIEDCKIEFFSIGIKVYGPNTGHYATNPTFRFNLILNQYGADPRDPEAQGIHTRFIDGLQTFEGNYVDNNGFNDDVVGNASRTIYNHGIYSQWVNTPMNTAQLINNFLSRNSLHGVMFRQGGDALDNVFIDNCIGFLCGSASWAGNDPPWPSGLVDGNVVIGSKNVEIGSNRNAAFSSDQSDGITYSNNYIANNQGTGIADTFYEVDVNGAASKVDNVIVNWGAGDDTYTAGQLDDPTRDLASYNLFVGGPGTEDDFYAEIRKQSQDTWNNDYSVGSILAYFKEGLTPV